MPSLTKRTALILNFTGNVYHWGCHGTSAEVYQSLLERDYQVSWLDVRSTHSLRPVPETAEDFSSPAFIAKFFTIHKSIHHAFQEADVIVVNGEGTLHRWRPAANMLLFLLHVARNVLRKPVHLINHSFFPSGGDESAEANDLVYGKIAASLTRVVPRETKSRAILKRLGIETAQGFDCLPRFIARHGVRPASTPQGPIVLSGSVILTEESAARMVDGVLPHVNAGRRVCFLAGAKSEPAGEDATIYHWMAARLPALERIDAPSMEVWLHTIASASCLVSGRFHHTIAAATLGTPAVTFPSNTPKVEAMCQMMEIEAPIAYDDPALSERVEHGVHAALNGRMPLCPPETLKKILGYAANNFSEI